MAARIKSTLFSLFNSAVDLVAGKGLGKLPGASAAYDFIFRYLWPGGSIIEIEDSKMYINLRDEPFLRKTFEAYISTPHWDELTTNTFKEVVKEGDVVLDLGANLGYYSLLAARLVGSQGKVYAFEPEPRNYRLLLKNIKLNGYSNIIPLQKAVSDETGKVKLFLSSKDSGAHNIRDSSNRIESREFVEIEAVNLDEFFAGKNHSVNVIKMDIEGSEPKAFLGMQRIMSENRDLKLFIEFYPDLIMDGGCVPDEFARRLIEDYKFAITVIDDNWKDKKQLTVSGVDELMEFVKDKIIVNLFLQRAC